MTNLNLAQKNDLENSKKICNFIVNYQRIKKVTAIKVLTQHTNFYHKQLKKNKGLLDLPKFIF